MQLDIYVHGEIDTIDAGRVLAGLSHLHGLVKNLGGGELQFTHLKSGSIDTGFTSLSTATDHTELVSRTDTAFGRLVAGLKAAEARPEVPGSWDDSAVKDGLATAEKLGTFTDSGADLILRDGRRVVDRVTVTGATSANLRAATKTTRTTIGSVIGRLDSLNVHGKREARVWPDRNGPAVVVHFSQGQINEVRDAVGQRVEVRGKLTRDYRDRPVRLQLRAITRLKTRDESPRLGTGAGIAPGAVTSTLKEYLETVRGTA
jgi:hypothetical protein